MRKFWTILGVVIIILLVGAVGLLMYSNIAKKPLPDMFKTEQIQQDDNNNIDVETGEETAVITLK